MTWEAEIPGMYISRTDMQLIIYEGLLKLSCREAKKKSEELTERQLNDIAYAFSEEFFDANEGLFAKLLKEAYKNLKVD
jgi:maleate cis-trans isomerase